MPFIERAKPPVRCIATDINDYAAVLQQYGYEGAIDIAPLKPNVKTMLVDLFKGTGFEVPAIYAGEVKAGPRQLSCPDVHALAPEHIVVSNKLLELLSDKEVVAVIGYMTGQMIHKCGQRDRDFFASAAATAAAFSLRSLLHAHPGKSEETEPKKFTIEETPEERQFSRRKLLSYTGAAFGTLAFKMLAKKSEEAAENCNIDLVPDKATLQSAFDKIKAWECKHNLQPMGWNL